MELYGTAYHNMIIKHLRSNERLGNYEVYGAVAIVCISGVLWCVCVLVLLWPQYTMLLLMQYNVYICMSHFCTYKYFNTASMYTIRNKFFPIIYTLCSVYKVLYTFLVLIFPHGCISRFSNSKHYFACFWYCKLKIFWSSAIRLLQTH